MNSAPDLTIKIKVTDSGSSITLRRPNAPDYSFETPLRREQLKEMRQLLRRDLDRFKDAVGQNLRPANRVDWTALNHAMAVLRERGLRLGYEIIGPNNSAAVEAFCRRACGWDRNTWRTPIVEIESREADIVPFEFIPIFRIKSPKAINSALKLDEEARSYLGFSAILKRSMPIASMQDQTIDGIPAVPVKIFQFAGLKVVTEIEAVFRHAGATVDGPWPDQPMRRQDFVDACRGFVIDPRRGFQSRRKSKPDQLYYFGCHCDTTSETTEKHHFVLSHDGTDQQPLTLGYLQSGLFQRAAPKEAGPLVFMNACGGATFTPTGVATFPALFLTGGYRGYIGTEARIPDGVAAEFARHFYIRFLKGRQLGECLLEARRTLLQRYANPLGLLYTAYAPSELRVRSKS